MTLTTLARDEEELVSASRSTTAKELAQQMGSKNVGSILITEDRRPVGIVTDRDLALAVVGEERSPAETTAVDLMSTDLVTVDVTDGVAEVCATMREHGVRRMPVMDGDEVTGILTLDDLIVLLEDELADISSVIESESPPYSG